MFLRFYVTFEATMCCFIPSISKPRNLFLYGREYKLLRAWFSRKPAGYTSEIDKRNKVSSLWSEREREREKSREFMHERPSGVDLISLRRLGLWLSDLFPGVFSWQGYARASRVPARDRWEDREQRRTRVRPLHAWERQTIWGRREGNENTQNTRGLETKENRW